MNHGKATNILEIIDGDRVEEALSTIGLAMIHAAYSCGLTKQNMLRAIAAQWDLYEQNEVEPSERKLDS